MKHLTKKKTITVECWVESNEDFAIVTDQNPEKKKKIKYDIVPTDVLTSNDPEKIPKLIRKFFKTFPEYAQKPMTVVSKKYWNLYKKGLYWHFDDYENAYEPWDKAVKLLKEKDYSRFVVDSATGNEFFYDAKARPIPRRFHFDYIKMHGQIRTYDYDGGEKLKMSPQELFDKLKKHPQAKNVRWVDIPYFNRDDNGVTEIPIFEFEPSSNRQFWNILKSAKDCWDVPYVIFKRLKINI
jgi:hypothetical protein